MEYIATRLILLVVISSVWAAGTFGQLAGEKLKQYEFTWENEDNACVDRWNALHELCTNHYVELNPDSAFYYADEYYESAAEARDTSHMIMALYDQHCCHTAKGEFVESISPLKKILALCEATGDQAKEASTLTQIGSMYVQIGEGEKGVEYLFRGIDLFLEMKLGSSADDLDEETILFSIANVYVWLNDWESAKPYLDRVQLLAPDYLGTQDSVSTLNNLGYTEMAVGNNALAKQSFFQALAIGKPLGPTYGKTLIGLGNIYLNEGKYDSSHFYYEKAIPIVEGVDHHPEEVVALVGLGNVFLEEKEYEKALDCGLRALPYAKSMHSLQHWIYVTRVLYEAYKGLEESVRSLEYYELYVEAKDRNESRDIYLKLKSKELTKILKDKQKVILADRKHADATYHTKLYLFVLGFVILLALLVLYYNKRLLGRKREREILMSEIKKLKQKSNEIDSPASKSDFEDLQGQKLDKEAIEKSINAKLNNTDWKILNALLNNPMVANKEIAEMIFLSVPGVRSSLQKMYRLFGIDGSYGNRRIALILAAVQQCVD